MDNSIDTTTTPIRNSRGAGRPKGVRNPLGMSIKDRLKILERIAKSTDKDVSEADRISAIKQITELLADKINPQERMLPVYMLRMELDRKSSYTEEIFSNTVSDIKEVLIQSTPPIESSVDDDNIQDDIGQDIMVDEGKEDAEKDDTSLF